MGFYDLTWKKKSIGRIITRYYNPTIWCDPAVVILWDHWLNLKFVGFYDLKFLIEKNRVVGSWHDIIIQQFDCDPVIVILWSYTCSNYCYCD